MRSPRENCKHRERCGRSGHLRTDKGWERCQCLQLEVNQRGLGSMYTEKPVEKSSLKDIQNEDLVIEGPLEMIRRHVARVLLDRSAVGESWVTIDAYRLIEIFLGQDDEFDTQAGVIDTDLLIILLGFGDPRNRYLPELLVQTLARRELTRKNTWVILGTAREMVSTKYSTEVYDRLKQMKHVLVR